MVGRTILGFDGGEYLGLVEQFPPVKIRTREQAKATESRIEDQLSEELLRGRMTRGDTVEVDVSPGGGFTFHVEPRRKETASQDSRPSNGAPA